MATENTDSKIDFFKYAVAITPYAILVALLYLWGSWSSFGINIFNYIALTDILKLALIPPLCHHVFCDSSYGRLSAGLLESQSCTQT
jgi:hypothetical protein